MWWVEEWEEGSGTEARSQHITGANDKDTRRDRDRDSVNQGKLYDRR